ncbi:MAG: DUF202 domain-containing protein [Pedococcus sp.]
MSPIPERTALQPERTALAWQRTAITSLMVLAPMVLVALRIDQPWMAGGGAAVMLLSVPLVLSVQRRHLELGDDDRGFSPLRPMVHVAVVTGFGAAGGVAVGIAVFLH